MAFSSFLKKLREERHLSQKDVAQYLGITRQAITSYELGKREPNYEILTKLADYFNVSVDYLLGRVNGREENAFAFGKNIELIRGGLSYKELSEGISRKTGVRIFPEILELYASGQRMPLTGTIKILSNYASVRDSFFYGNNTVKTFEQEKELYKKEIELEYANQSNENTSFFPGFSDSILVRWMRDEENLKYLALAKEIKDVGLSVDALQPLINTLKGKKTKLE